MPASDPWVPNLWDLEASRWRHSDDGLVGDEDDDGRITELLGIVPACRVLDAGCGAGRRSRSLAQAGAHVVGIDTSISMLALARESRPNPGVARADVTRLPFPDDTFDAALCAYVLDFTADVAAALSELRRVVRSDGRLLVSLLGARSGPRRGSWRRFLGEPDVTCGPLPWEMEPLLTFHGWQLVYQEGVFGRGRDGTVNPIGDPSIVDPATWTPGLQALANGWRFLSIVATAR